MATKLDNVVLTDALNGLDDWHGDTTEIRRTVEVGGADAETLVAEVATAADAMDHHPDVTRGEGRITFTLSTHSDGGVTELDITLASRIDDFVLKAHHEHRTLDGDIVPESQIHGGSTTEREPEISVGSDDDIEVEPTLGEPAGGPLIGTRDPARSSDGRRIVPDEALDPRHESREV